MGAPTIMIKALYKTIQVNKVRFVYPYLGAIFLGMASLFGTMRWKEGRSLENKDGPLEP